MGLGTHGPVLLNQTFSRRERCALEPPGVSGKHIYRQALGRGGRPGRLWARAPVGSGGWKAEPVRWGPACSCRGLFLNSRAQSLGGRMRFLSQREKKAPCARTPAPPAVTPSSFPGKQAVSPPQATRTETQPRPGGGRAGIAQGVSGALSLRSREERQGGRGS